MEYYKSSIFDEVMNSKIAKMIDISELKPEQVKQIQSIVDIFKHQNELQKQKDINKNTQELDFWDDIFFESEIIKPFDRTILYGERIKTNLS